jgi:hypothetical protein
MQTVFVVLYLIACVDLTNRDTCVRVAVTDNTQAQPDGLEMNMSGCMGVQGVISARRYWEEHPDMHETFKFGDWSCEIGNHKQPKKKAI